MSSQHKLVGDMATPIPVPELSDAEYFASVLQLAEDRTESQIEDDLVAKANELGISIATPEKRITSSVESASTVATYHARTFSMLSIGSDSTALTNYSSLFGPSSPDPSVPSRRGSKDLNFSHYDRYLSIIDPHHTHHKSFKKPASPDASTQSIFSGKTKKSIFGKSGFKIRWKKKTPQPLEVMLLVSPIFILYRSRTNKTPQNVCLLPCGLQTARFITQPLVRSHLLC